mgnify:CR=1 FL=1
MTNEKQQTAVEWLVEQLEGDNSKIVRVIGLKKYNFMVKQAKEMEKEQICHAVNQHYVIPENYYYKTYGGNK